MILNRANPIGPKRIDAFYKKFLQPVIDVHRRIGIQAEYKPVNDLVVQHRKISGTGAGEIGDSIVFVGLSLGDDSRVPMAGVARKMSSRSPLRLVNNKIPVKPMSMPKVSMLAGARSIFILR